MCRGEIRIVARKDEIINLVSAPHSWTNQEVNYVDKIDVCAVSLGARGDITEAGSFGCWLSSIGGEVMGLTTSHYLPGAGPGTTIVSPSTIEFTARLSTITRYTDFGLSPLPNRRMVPEREVIRMLEVHEIQLDECGLVVAGLNNNHQPESSRIIISGPTLGHVSAIGVGYRYGLLKAHNRRLKDENIRGFTIQNNVKSKYDWLTFRPVKKR